MKPTTTSEPWEKVNEHQAKKRNQNLRLGMCSMAIMMITVGFVWYHYFKSIQTIYIVISGLGLLFLIYRRLKFKKRRVSVDAFRKL